MFADQWPVEGLLTFFVSAWLCSALLFALAITAFFDHCTIRLKDIYSYLFAVSSATVKWVVPIHAATLPVINHRVW